MVRNCGEQRSTVKRQYNRPKEYHEIVRTIMKKRTKSTLRIGAQAIIGVKVSLFTYLNSMFNIHSTRPRITFYVGGSVMPGRLSISIKSLLNLSAWLSNWNDQSRHKPTPLPRVTCASVALLRCKASLISNYHMLAPSLLSSQPYVLTVRLTSKRTLLQALILYQAWEQK
jgi:hypothetical protein